MDKKEQYLIDKAQNHPDENVANLAMKRLKEQFDTSYMFCADCDGLVCKKKDCCMEVIKDKASMKEINKMFETSEFPDSLVLLKGSGIRLEAKGGIVTNCISSPFEKVLLEEE